MASIFTFDPDPPRVSSPWSTPRTSTPRADVRTESLPALNSIGLDLHGAVTADPDIIVTSLEAEPQEGPTEYKLHLLLRRRRSFTRISTGGHVSGSSHSSAVSSRKVSDVRPAQPLFQLTASSQPRQLRLQQLTTQLLWRLQQSSSNHSSTHSGSPSVNALHSILKSGTPIEHGRVLPGLEDSKGALYEIGVADDGTFIGLVADELEESLETLRIMASSLGCKVNVLRKAAVGDCEWVDHKSDPRSPKIVNETLWVAEAYIQPNWSSSDWHSTESGTTPLEHVDESSGEIHDDARPATEQLRLTLTGATMSGKSSLLGSLTTGTLDNGRGKSRLSLLKHQHEIATGITSSVTQELVGYRNKDAHGAAGVQVVNYASGNVSSWLDIHATCESGPEPGRVVFLSDSAGHPRYRRTTVRGLVGWAPHWTLLCIPADSEDTLGMAVSREVLGLPNVDPDLSQEHLELCLKLDVPLVIAITKLDLASKPGLRSCLSKVLSALKQAGRRPIILPDARGPVSEADMKSISGEDLHQVRQCVAGIDGDHRQYVPIVLTSAVRGSGMSKLHALLHELPIPALELSSRSEDVLASNLFDVEDIYKGKAEAHLDSHMFVLSGAMRYGQISVGDELVLGPFSIRILEDVDPLSSSPGPSHSPHIPTSRSFPGALNQFAVDQLRGAECGQEWRRVTVRSVRNLRLPVRTLQSGQVGTIGVVSSNPAQSASLIKVRKGMVVAKGNPSAHGTFIADFARTDVDSLSINSNVVVYFNSVRASARITAGAMPEHRHASMPGDHGFAFGFEDDDDNGDGVEEEQPRLLVTFQFLASREYVEGGTQVLVMPGGGPGIYGASGRGEKGLQGLLGFVGKVVEVR
jgi:GTPase